MDWDFIIVGAGSAGCALAHQLARSHSGKILLVEAGESDRSMDVSLPFRMLQALDRYDWGYRCEPDASRMGRSEGWQRGKLVGGTSSVNGMIYVRGSTADFMNWARLADESWAPENILPLFREMERCDRRSIASQDAERGFSGPLHVRQVMRPHRTTQAFVAAMDAQGYPLTQTTTRPLRKALAIRS